MALEITEGQELMNFGLGTVGQIFKASTILGTQIVAIPGSSAVLNKSTKGVRLHTDTICRVNIGVGGPAASAGWRMVANQTEYWGVNGGETVTVTTST